MSNKQIQSATKNVPSLSRPYGIRRRVVVAFICALGLFGGIGGWAAQAKLSGAIIAQGKVSVEKQIKQIQHRNGGVVAAILVENGQAVKASDVLIRLDDTQTFHRSGDALHA